MKIPFDIKYRPEIESGKYKVQTTDGRDVRIVCWDKHTYGGRIDLVALVPTSEGNTETCQLYNPDGSLIASTWNEKFKLVLITDEPELTEFEQNVRSCIVEHLTTRTKTADGGEISSTVFFSDATTREIAKELLDLGKQKNLFESGRGLYYYDGEKTTYIGYPATEENSYDFAMNQQENQKESLHISETCKENTGSFTDEDERIRKDIIRFLEVEKEDRDAPFFDTAITYLEKQKEQKSAWSEEDKEALDMCLDAIPKSGKPKAVFYLRNG